MAVAWIIWRTPEAVREHWDKYRRECTVWVSHSWPVCVGGRNEIGWHTEKRSPVSVYDILQSAPRNDVGGEKLNAVFAVKSFERELSAGKIIATAKATQFHPTIRHRNRTEIRKLEWLEFSLEIETIYGSDSVSGVDEAPHYVMILVEREQILRIWEKIEPPDANKPSKTRCRTRVERR